MRTVPTIAELRNRAMANGWEILLEDLKQVNDWETLWQAAQIAPVGQIVRIVLDLKEAGWEPKPDEERSNFRDVLELSEKLNAISPALMEYAFQHCQINLKRDPSFPDPRRLAISPDGRFVVSGEEWSSSRTAFMNVWSLPARKLLYKLKEFTTIIEGTQYVQQLTVLSDLVISPDGTTLAATEYSHVILWNLCDGQQLRVLRTNDFYDSAQGHSLDLYPPILFSPDGQLMIATVKAYTEPRLYGHCIWRVSDGIGLSVLKGHEDTIWHTVISADGQFLASGSQDCTVRLWSLPEVTELHTLKHSNPVYRVVISSAGHLLASACDDNSAYLWNVSDGTMIRKFEGYFSRPFIAFSPDDQILAICVKTTEKERHIQLWSVPDGVLLKTMPTDNSAGKLFQFSPDSKYLTAVDFDWGVRIWSLVNDKAMFSLEGMHSSFEYSLAVDSAEINVLARSRYDCVEVFLPGIILRVFNDSIRGTDVKQFETIAERWDVSETTQEWLTLFLKLVRKHLSLSTSCLVSAAKKDPTFTILPEQLEFLLTACQEADDVEVAFTACEYLMTRNQSEAASRLCSRWHSGSLSTQADALAMRLFTVLHSGCVENIQTADVELVEPLLRVCAEPDPVLAERARNVLKPLRDLPDARDRLGLCYLEQNDRIARDILLEQFCAPHDSCLRAVWHFLTEQWEQYETADPDQQFLAAAYERAGESLRQRILNQTRQAVRFGWMQVARRGHSNQERMNDAEWTTTVAVLKATRDWPELWELTRFAPTVWAIRIVLLFEEAGWQPKRADEQAVLQSMIPLAQKCCQNMDDPLPLRQTRLTGHSAPVFFVSISPDGKMLVSVSRDNTIRIWSLPNGRTLRILKVCLNATETIYYRYDAKQEERPVDNAKLTCAAVSPDWKLLACGGEDGKVRLWRLPDGEELQTMDTGTYTLADYPPEFDTDALVVPNTVFCLAFSPNGMLLASGHFDGSIRLWRLPDGKQIHELYTRSTVHGVVFSPDSALLAGSDSEGTVRLWKVSDGQQLLDGYYERHPCLAISPDGQVLASGSGKIIRLWHLPDCALLQSLEGHPEFVRTVTFSPDGKLLAVGYSDATIWLWNLTDGTFLHTMYTEDLPVYMYEPSWKLAFSPDNSILAGCKDNVVRLWRISNGMALRTFPEWTSDLSINPDGWVLVVCLKSGGIQLWTLWQIRVNRLLAEPATFEDLKFVENILRQEPITDSERLWLEFIRILTRWQQQLD